MDFLKSAVYCRCTENEPAKLVGAIITKFNQNKLTERPYSQFLSAKDLLQSNNPTLDPRGFVVKEDMTMLSDTPSQVIVDDDPHKDYIIDNMAVNNANKIGLLDVILFGLSINAELVVNYDNATEYSEYSFVNMKRLKVSNSSFNIYAPHRLESGEFRTLSLVDIEKLETIPFYMCISGEAKSSIPDWFCDVAEYVGDIKDNKIYKVTAPLVGSSAFVGEAFCNYLAYQTAFYEIGGKIVDFFLNEYKLVAKASSVRSMTVYDRKKQEMNVKITSSVKNPMIKEVLELSGDVAYLKDLLKVSEEARVTYEWLKHIYSFSSGSTQDNGMSDMAASLFNLRDYCNTQRLRHAIELLSQRIYLSGFFPDPDPAPNTFRGGGVCGISFKELTW